ncbi:unnamed protein product [Caenorhabditis sp. 36 PRJEB53466]|nr:unnamed protein product [Caenorhabditis sp. 36 PRJEB53466]
MDKRTLVISDPDLVHEVLVKQYDNFYGRKTNPIDGDPDKDKRINLFNAQGFRWKRLRAISSPTFSNGNLRKLKDTVEDCAIELLRHIEEQTAGGQQIDMLEFYQEFTLDVIGRLAMGQIGSQQFRNPMLKHVKAVFGENRTKSTFLIGGIVPAFAQFFRFFMLKLPRSGQRVSGPEISFDQLTKLKYLDCVIKETLRLYPLATLGNSRKCMRATQLGNVSIEPGTMIQVDTWTVHTDPSIWGADAESFRPERWEGSTEQHKSGGYIPFGLGPRQCIGMRLAYMEEKLLLAHLLRKYTFQPGARTRIPLKLVGRATTQPDSVWMHLKARE